MIYFHPESQMTDISISLSEKCFIPGESIQQPAIIHSTGKNNTLTLSVWFIKTRFSKRRDRVEKWQRSYLISSVDPRALKHSKSNTLSTFYCWTVFLWAPALTKGAATFILKGVPDRKCSVPLAAVHLPLRDGVPAEVELPVEAAVGHVGARHVFKRIVADHVDDGTHHRPPFEGHTHTHTQHTHT